MKTTASISEDIAEDQPALLLLQLPRAIIQRILQECSVSSLGTLLCTSKETRMAVLEAGDSVWACAFQQRFGTKIRCRSDQDQSGQTFHNRCKDRLRASRRWVAGDCIRHEGLKETFRSRKPVSAAILRGDYLLLGLEQGAVEVWELAFGQCVCVLTGLESHAPVVSLDAQGTYVVALGENSVACSWEIPEDVLPRGVGAPPYARAASAATHSCYSAHTCEEGSAAQGYRWHPGDAPVEVRCWIERELPTDGVLSLTAPRASSEELQKCTVQGPIVISSTGSRVHPDAYHLHTCPDLLHLHSFSVHAHASRFDREHSLLSACTPGADQTQWSVTTTDLYTGQEVANFSSADVVWEGDSLQPEECAVTDLFCGEAHVLVEINSFILILWDLSPCLDTSCFPYRPHRSSDPTSSNDLQPKPILLSMFALEKPCGTREMGEFVHGVAFDIPRLDANPNAAVFVVTDWSDLFNYLSQPRNSFRFWDARRSRLLSVVSLRYDASNTLIDLVRFDPSLAGEGTATAVLAMDAVDGCGMGLAVWTTPNRNGCDSSMIGYQDTKMFAEPETVFYPEQAGHVGTNCPKRLLGGEAVIEYPPSLLRAYWDAQTLITDASWRWMVVVHGSTVAILDFLGQR